MADRKLLTETRLRRRMKRTTKHGKKGLSMHSFLVRWSGAPFACTQRKALGSTVRLDIEAPCTLSVGCSTSPARLRSSPARLLAVAPMSFLAFVSAVSS